ncbi:MAG: lysine--tRNA ligase [Desulfobacterales bacterium]|nr:lysine--tRNA ligase [Desulfobacterales bacterium]
MVEDKNNAIDKKLTKIDELKNKNIELFPNDFKVSHSIKDIFNIIDTGSILNEYDPEFSMAGRIMAINKFGKSLFIRIKDRTGRIQAYIQKNIVGDENYEIFKLFDIGDFIGVKGGAFKTKTGEWTIFVKTFKLLCKALRPLPEKFHGLKDPEKRYRQRYLDIIMNNDVRDIFIKRTKMIQSIRSFFLKNDFLEVETPMMQIIPGGAEAKPFITYHNALDMSMYLRIAPELYLKRLVVGGFERVFEINRNFRNEGISTQHNPEFTMLEFYQAYANYEDLMNFTEELFRTILNDINGSTQLEYQGSIINFEGQWKRINLYDSLLEIGGLLPEILNDKEKLLNFADEKGITIQKKEKLGKILTKLFDALVEPKLIQPTFITGYPVEVSPLSRKNKNNPELTDRFELFIAGREIANGFSELNDPWDQKERFLMQVKEREEGDEEAHYMDEDYILALEYGMPPTAGEGIGIDRLAMLLTNSSSIREVILFPHMKQR